MNKKHALIVDDSKSARFALKRMLDELNLEVDTVESAAEAIRYLQQQQPDIIFMDHMMPGMDGFEAVKQIKNNPQTALIPIMMYTSKGGDVYMSQARALGAVGIIRKTIAPVELRDSLLELGLIDDLPPEKQRPSPDTSSRPSSTPISPAKKNVLDVYIQDLRKLMDDQTIELHRSMWLGIESVSNEIFNRLNSDLDEKIEKIQSALSEKQNSTPLYRRATVWLLFLMAFLLLVSLGYNIRLLSSLKTADLQPREAENERAAMPDRQPPAPQPLNTDSPIETDRKILQKSQQEFIHWVAGTTMEYPYNEIALNDKRLPVVKEIIQRALEANYKGHIILQTHVGEFCLSSDQTGTYRLADENTPVASCDMIGNTIQPTDQASSHQSLSFVNYLSDSERLNQWGILLEVSNLNRKIPLAEYPQVTAQTTAAQWNRAAQLNNRIHIKLIPESGALMNSGLE